MAQEIERKSLKGKAKRGRPPHKLPSKQWRVSCSDNNYETLLAIGEGYPTFGLRRLMNEAKRQGLIETLIGDKTNARTDAEPER